MIYQLFMEKIENRTLLSAQLSSTLRKETNSKTMAVKLTMRFYPNSENPNIFHFVHYNYESEMCTTLKMEVQFDDEKKLSEYKIMDAHYQGKNDFWWEQREKAVAVAVAVKGKQNKLPFFKANSFFRHYWLNYYNGKTIDGIIEKIEC